MFIGKERANVILRKADTARDSKKWHEASIEYRRYLQRKPKDAAIWVQLGHACKESGDFDGAQEAYSRSLALAPQSADAQLQMGHFLKIKNERRRAIAHYQRAYEINPELEDAIVELTALGEPVRPQQELNTNDRIDKIDEQLASLRRSVDPVFRTLNTFMSNAATLNSLGFELVAQERRFDARFTELDRTVELLGGSLNTLGQLPNKVNQFDENLKRLLALTADMRAVSTSVARLTRDVSTWREHADLRVAALENDVSALAKSHETDHDNDVAWHQAIEKRLEDVAISPLRLTELQRQLAHGLRGSDALHAAALSTLRAELEALAVKLNGVAALPTKLDVAALASALADSGVVDAVRATMAQYFAPIEARHNLNAALDAQVNNGGEVPNSAPGSDRALVDLAADLRDRTERAELRTRQLEEVYSRTNEMQSYLVNRIEFVRREMMFEFRHGRRDTDLAVLDTKTKIVSVTKFEEQFDSPRLNIGCGHIPVDGYLNVDRRELRGVDIVAEADKLPFKSKEVAEIRSAHLLEHFPQEQLRRSLLPYWLDLLKPGGVFLAIVPDAAEMIANAGRGEYAFADFREVFFGAQDYDGDYHYNMFTPESLVELLKEAGFEKSTIIERGRRNGACFEFEISARRPSKSPVRRTKTPRL